MTFYLYGFRSFPKLWKNNLYLGFGPGCSYLFLVDSSGIRNQPRWFSLATLFLQNTKTINLQATSTRYLRKEDKRRNKQVSSDSPHFFAAGAAKKRAQMNPQSKESVISPPLNDTIQLPTKPLTSEEWDKLKENFKRKTSFESWISSQLIYSKSSLDVAKSLLAWVAAKNNGIVSYDLLVKYLYLCVFYKQTSEIIDVYEIMKVRYKRLETEGYTLLIRGLMHSDRWREAFLLLEEIKKVMIPSKRNYDDCIQGALHHQDTNTAWNLYQELLGHNLNPMLETLEAFFDFGKDIKDDQYANRLLEILLYLRNNQLYPGESFARSIKTWFESGQCLGCGRTMESIYLSAEEYGFLKENIMRNVIDGGDQYRKTTPEELKRFQDFVKHSAPFDIVIDGLNVAKMFPKARESQVLLDVVTQLAKQNLRLLVLGRKHMLNYHSRWRKDEMKKVQNQANCFFADNISEDDPFLLYATLHSGNHCKFITKDLMRDHKACLPDAKTQRLFFKWQQGHQLAITSRFPASKLTFQHVFCYDTVVQTTGDSWHIPYDEDLVERYSYELPNKWLCLQRKT
ncbi:PREDICTED: mitochondrial ribonuclease P protein 3 isoform X2 [Elephantulus edwardii]|uniref:mitochondrial ribonuclease P protein 3 isoform X2 n=1 Tax=Elephantulus edwardii TaxID=28737 RepID=UPI0003F07FA8|nr:PREDICTED: mitochondrial ribonuclease P protein 3 isoform X2 [Elephantulus edwardii]